VVGVEGDLAFPDVSPRATFFSPLNDPSAFPQDLDWFGTVRGRAGIAFDQVLIYATGGVAFGDVTNSVAFLRKTDLAYQYAGRSSFNSTHLCLRRRKRRAGSEAPWCRRLHPPMPANRRHERWWRPWRYHPLNHRTMILLA
jgi:opacity protein-like surface antigen